MDYLHTAYVTDVIFFVGVFVLSVFALLTTLVQALLGTSQQSFERWMRIYVRWALAPFAQAALLFAIPSLIYVYLLNQQQLTDLLNEPWFVIPTCAGAVALYRVRSRRPVVYGSIEIAIAVATVWFAVTSSNQNSLPIRVVSIMGGVYVFIRGMDNVDRGLTGNAKQIWTRLFK